MPTSASTNQPEDLVARLSSGNGEVKLKALRELKNQIIGNKTKKLSYINLGAVPTVVKILAGTGDFDSSLLIQSAVTIGSFAWGIDAGVEAVIQSGAVEHLFGILSHPNDKVVDASARSLRMIYQSELAPKYDVLQEKNMKNLLSLLNSENENVTGLGASIITHSCATSPEQKALCDMGVLRRLVCLLNGSLNQRDASLRSLAAIVKNNPEVTTKFVKYDNGRALSVITGLMTDRYSRTRLLACICLIVIRNTSPCHLEETGSKTKLISILLELLEEPDQVGDEAPFAFADLIKEKEDLQKLAFEVKAVDKLCNFLHRGPAQVMRFQGILKSLAELCSNLECCRSRFMSLQVLNLVVDVLNHDSAEVRTEACLCIRNVSRSVQNLSAGNFMNELIVNSLIRLLEDHSASVQVAAVGAISNVVVDFTTHRSTFIQCGGVKELVQLSNSMGLPLRSGAVCALRNLTFQADNNCREEVFMELTVSTLESLIRDPESSVQEQALALVCNLVDGSVKLLEHVVGKGGLILNAVGKQLGTASKSGVLLQGMYVLCNVAVGNEFHKEAVMNLLLPPEGSCTHSVIIKFLQSDDSELRTVTIWCLITLTEPGSPGASARVLKLLSAGIISRIKNMDRDPCMDVKLRIQQLFNNISSFSDSYELSLSSSH